MSFHSNREFSEYEKDIFYDVIFSRRDVRQNFIIRKIEDNVLFRILKAAHHAPSVGFSQPWNFILIKNRIIRERIKESFIKERLRSIELLEDKDRQKKYLDLKLEGILESDINICVTYDHKRFGPFVIGRMTIKDAGIYSVCCAIQNLWLASRVEGIGVGWVSIIDNEEIIKTLNLPDDVKPIAYLCLGYVDKFNDSPDLEKKNWLNRLSLKDVIFFERWNNEINNDWKHFQSLLSQ